MGSSCLCSVSSVWSLQHPAWEGKALGPGGTILSNSVFLRQKIANLDRTFIRLTHVPCNPARPLGVSKESPGAFRPCGPKSVRNSLETFSGVSKQSILRLWRLFRDCFTIWTPGLEGPGRLFGDSEGGFQRFSEVFSGFERFSEVFQRPSQRPSQSATFLSELRVVLPLIMLPLKLLQQTQILAENLSFLQIHHFSWKFSHLEGAP